jgi:hypothetical protein
MERAPAGYHCLNLLLHMGNVLLVYALGLRLSKWRRAAAVQDCGRSTRC